MKHGHKILLGIALAVFSIVGCAQQKSPASNGSVEVSPGFKLRPNGVIDIGDAFVEVNYYDSKWTIAQQHDRFVQNTPPGSHTINGILTTAGGLANLSETITAIADGIEYAATLTSNKPLPTNELSLAFLLPTKSFAGKQIMIDGQPLMLPVDPAKKGEPKLLEKADAHRVDVPTPKGMLAITGNFYFLIQDDREWGDPRYSMRLYFTPGSGEITTSKIDLEMRMKP